MTSHRPVTPTVHSVFIYQDTGPGWAPADPAHFYVDGMVFAGTEIDGRADAFDFELCTPSWLAEHFDDRPAAPAPQAPAVPRPEPSLRCSGASVSGGTGTVECCSDVD